MTENEIIEKKQALVMNDIAWLNRRIDEINNEVAALEKKKFTILRKISKKDIYYSQLESDKTELV